MNPFIFICFSFTFGAIVSTAFLQSQIESSGMYNTILQFGAFGLLVYIVVYMYPKSSKEAREERKEREDRFALLVESINKAAKDDQSLARQEREKREDKFTSFIDSVNKQTSEEQDKNRILLQENYSKFNEEYKKLIVEIQRRFEEHEDKFARRVEKSIDSSNIQITRLQELMQSLIELKQKEASRHLNEKS